MSMNLFNQCFRFIDFMVRFTDFLLFSVPVLVTVMIFCKHFHMGRIVSVASAMYGLEFCFIVLLIRFTDFLLFLNS